MNFTEVRLKVRHFFRKYRRILFVIFIIWAIIFFINRILSNMTNDYVGETTYEPHVAVINDSKVTSSSMKKNIEEMVEQYVTYCNAGEFDKAFEMLSTECKEYEFDNNIEKYMSYVYTKMPTPKKYALQNYSSTKYGGKTMYIYEVKYTDDLLATGLTNSTYSYTSEDITFFEGEDGLEMNVGNYIYHTDIKNISENEYLKIDVVDKIVNYSIETYTVKFTNRSNYTIVIADGQEDDEVLLVLPNETRKRTSVNEIVLQPGMSDTLTFTFPKFVDDGDISQSIAFSSIRVMEKYSGVGDDISKEVIQSEIDNAISKFSMTVSVAE